MTKKTKIFLTTLSSLILVLVIINIALGLGNQSIQAEVSERQQIIAQTLQLETLNRQLIGVLANMAIKTNDEQLKKVLAESGINLGPADAPVPTRTAPTKK
jgi:predicted Holliday junction resolvase-like endonuclease